MDYKYKNEKGKKKERKKTKRRQAWKNMYGFEDVLLGSRASVKGLKIRQPFPLVILNVTEDAMEAKRAFDTFVTNLDLSERRTAARSDAARAVFSPPLLRYL